MSDVTGIPTQTDDQLVRDTAQSEHNSTTCELREDVSTDSDRSSRNRSRRLSAAATPSKSTESMTSTPKSKSPNAPVARTARTTPGQTSAKVAGEASSKQVASPTGSAKNMKVPSRPGIPWIPGTRLEAKDYLDKWYPARVHDVDFEDCTVLIHFEGWNQRYDEWVTMDSDDLRPVARHSERSKEKPKRVQREEHRPGDYVFAKWTDCRMYPARVTRVNHNGSYEVLFYDGFRKTVQEMNIRAMPPDIQQEYAKAGLLPDGTKRGKCPDGVGLSKNVPPTLKDVMAMLKAVAIKRFKEEDVLGKKRKRMSIGESVTAKKARLAMDDTDIIEQKWSAKQPKQVKMNMSSDHLSTSSSHGDSMDEDDMKLTDLMKGDTAGSSASSISDKGEVETMKEPLYVVDAMPLTLDGGIKKKRQAVARKEFKVEADHNEFKCVEGSCAKSFRKKSLLDYHIKYYHMTPDIGPTMTPTPTPAAPRKRKKTTSTCSTDSEISVGGHTGGSRKKRDSAASLSSLPPDTPTTHTAPVAASNSPAAAETTPQEATTADTHIVEEAPPGGGEESIPEEPCEDRAVATVTSSPVKVKDEVVNCICRMSEETGLMVQCDVCLCWQHAACMELSEDALPCRYVCFVCSNAPGLRDSARYLHDQDWLQVGAMAHFDFLPPDPNASNKAQIVRTTHDLMGDVHHVQTVLDSLRRNIKILETKKQPELGFWTENWDEKLAARKTDIETDVDRKDVVRRTLDMHTDQPSDPGSDLQQCESDVKVTVTSEAENKTEVGVKAEVDADLPLQKCSEFKVDSGKDAAEMNTDGTAEKLLSEKSSEVCQKLSDSSVKDAIPSIESSSHQVSGAVVTASGGVTGAGGEDSTKSEDSEEASEVSYETHLLQHIVTSQSAIDSSLDIIEEQVTVLEMGEEMGREGEDILRDSSLIKRSLHQLIADLATVRRIAAFH